MENENIERDDYVFERYIRSRQGVYHYPNFSGSGYGITDAVQIIANSSGELYFTLFPILERQGKNKLVIKINRFFFRKFVKRALIRAVEQSQKMYFDDDFGVVNELLHIAAKQYFNSEGGDQDNYGLV